MPNLNKKHILGISVSLILLALSAFLFWKKTKAQPNIAELVRQELSLNPQLIADLIVAHPELFINALANARSLVNTETEKPVNRGLSLSGKLEPSKPEVVEYYNLACPTCKKAYQLLNELKVKEKFQVTLKHVHMEKYPQASIAAQFLEVLYQYNPPLALKFLDEVFTHQEELMETEDIQSFVSQSLRKIGVSEVEEAKILNIIKEEKIYDRLAQYREEAKKMKITSTPSFIVKDKVYQGLPPREIFKNILGLK